MAEKTIPQPDNLVSTATSTGPVRDRNEDSLLAAHEGNEALYVVADGVGGQEYGAVASRIVTEAIKAAFYRERRAGAAIPAALTQAVREANEEVYRASQERQGRMGSTVVTAVQHQATLYLTHVGDARAYLLREGNLRPLTKDHTWVQEQVDSGLITAEQAKKHELRNVVTRVLGNKETVDIPSIKTITLQKDDIYLLCSDGLYDTLPKEQLTALLTTTQTATALVTAAEEAGASDNITAIVVQNRYIAPASAAPAPAQKWGWGILGGIVGLLVLAGLFLLLRPFLGSVMGGEAAPTAVPAATIPQTGLATLPPTVTPPPHATSTLRPTPTATVAATETAVLPTEQRGCAISAAAYVWPSSAVNRSDCASTITELVLARNEPVLILNATPVSAPGPDPGCQPHEFIEIQSETRPEVQGWVVAGHIRPLAAGQSCTP